MCKYIIVGKAASGKDWLQNIFIERGYKPLIQYTTRPKRPYETGNEYHFCSKKKIENMNKKMKFASLKIFNDWFYGFTIDDLKKCDVAIMSPLNINDLKNWYPDILKLITIIYLDIPINVRKNRLETRYNGGNEDDSIARRVNADEKDFENFNYFDIRFTNNDEATAFINKITSENN